MSRTDVVQRIAALIGSDILHITEVRDGWPSIAEILIDDSPWPVSLFVAPVTLSHRERDHIERRIQNPGQNRPITEQVGRTSLLIGLWESDAHQRVANPVLMAADPKRRVNLQTRYSVFVGLNSLLAAADKGWSEDVSASDEQIVCFHPGLLPTYVQMVCAGVQLDSQKVQIVAASSGLISTAAVEPPDIRARRNTSSLIRDARFAQAVIEAYDGLCAMCGLDFGLVQGAHIYPASAPGSSDTLGNGVALCTNHHYAFDRHYLFVHPKTRQVKLHPHLTNNRERNESCRFFVDSTSNVLAEPRFSADRPSEGSFTNRYTYFAQKYEWAD